MRTRHLSHYSDYLPKPITDDVQLALLYANRRVLTQIASASVARQWALRSKQASASTCDKAVMTTTAGGDSLADMSIGSNQLSYSIREMGDREDAGLQTSATPQGHRRARSRYKQIVEEWELKQKRFESVSAEREAAMRLADEQKSMEEEQTRASLLQSRKERLLERHVRFAEQKRVREEMRKAGEESVRKLRASIPLHQRAEICYKINECKETEELRERLSRVTAKMRRVSSREIQEHEEAHGSVRESILLQKNREREARLQRIREENSSRVYYRPAIAEVDAEERRVELEKQRTKTARAKDFISRQRMYAQIAMELHRPKSFVRYPKITLPKTSKTPTLPKSTLQPKPKFIRRRQFSVKLTEKTPQQSPSERSFVKDYNTERREEMEKSVLNSDRSSPLFNYVSSEEEQSPRDFKGLREKAGRLTRDAKLGEIFIQRLSQDPTLHAQACSSVSEMYLDSIKAKLKLITASLS